jgi:hypothetical protein
LVQNLGAMVCVILTASAAASGMRTAPRCIASRSRISVRPQAFFNFFKPKQPAAPAVKAPSPVQPLLDALQPCNRGLDVTAAQLKDISTKIDELAQKYSESTTTDDNLSATWRMLFTTEQASSGDPCCSPSC